MKYRVGVECGQRWWRLRSWQRHPSSDNLLRFRRIPTGFAVGPLMVFKVLNKKEGVTE